MAVYAIGDVQGCFLPLMRLLKTIQFDPQTDRLIFCGDLVNRGGQSLDVLRWVYAHQSCCQTVLGNHDLSLMSRYYQQKTRTKNTEFKAIFNAPDVPNIMTWLLQQPLYIEYQDRLIIHAGLYPHWSVDQFKTLATQTMNQMRQQPGEFFKTMYGNTPKKWSADLPVEDQNRFVINASTRMRFVKKDGSLNLSQSGRTATAKNLNPWYTYLNQEQLPRHIVFGHWSALGLFQDRSVTCLDSGRVWGGQLTAMDLDSHAIYSVS